MRGAAIKLRAACETHLWIVITEPAPKTGAVIAYNLTDAENYPHSTCILQPGDHPYITIPSAVRYFSPKIWDSAVLQNAISKGLFDVYPNASDKVIEKIIIGAMDSVDVTRDMKALIKKSLEETASRASARAQRAGALGIRSEAE